MRGQKGMKTVVIDPMFGEHAEGSIVERNGMRIVTDEASGLALDVGLATAQMVDMLQEVYSLRMRVSDTFLNPDERSQSIVVLRADLVIHISVRAGRSDFATYYWPGNREGAEVSDQILRAKPRRFGAPSGTMTMTEAHDTLALADCTSVVVDIGAEPGSEDWAYLKSRSGQRSIAAACLCGITRWLEMRDPA